MKSKDLIIIAVIAAAGFVAYGALKRPSFGNAGYAGGPVAPRPSPGAAAPAPTPPQSNDVAAAGQLVSSVGQVLNQSGIWNAMPWNN